MSSTEFNFKVFLIFLGIRWINFEIFLNFVNLEIVDRYTMNGVKRSFHILIELKGEIVSIVNSEYSLIEVDILWHIEIFPRIVLLGSKDFGNFLSIDKNALCDSWVFYTRFGHMDSVIIQVIIHDARTNTIIF